jgi:DNA-binding response OmpR family regulator
MKTKVLIIDDDATLLHLLGRYLHENGYEALEAANGPAGLRLAYNEHPNLILLDVMLPGMDGWEVCVRLKELSEMPIIMLTAKTTEADKLRGFDLGVDDYITKPFSFAELVARIEAVLARVQGDNMDSHLLAFGGTIIDLEKYQAYSENVLLDLTPTEYKLLKSLVRKQGKVISERELMVEVWGDTKKDPALVRRYISLLRKKMEPDPSRPVWIRTARGFGYSLSRGKDPNK